MKIKDILKNVEIISCENNAEKFLDYNVKFVCDNTNNVNKLNNSLFVCINGINFDSHNTTGELEKLGVKFFVCEKNINTTLPYIIVKNTRKTLSFIANNFYNNPTKNMKLIGVIGTNGKTSTTYFIKQLLDNIKIKTGLIGTSGVYINNTRVKETLTTPDPMLLFELLYKMNKANTQVVVMEISAHAIYYDKVSSLFYDALIFSNFSQDHLDFFKTMENYKQTKLSFFTKQNTKNAIINFDNKVGKELFNKIKNEINTKTFSIKEKTNLQAENIKLFLNKTNFDLLCDNKKYNITTKTACEFNIYNILASILTLNVLEINFDYKKVLSKLKEVKGRFNCFKLKKNSYVIVDYAHTPESLKSVLENIKKIGNYKIISLFGCPGNRDETKRELMGKIAYDYSKKVIITVDNPKYENPLIICAEILKGAKEKGVIVENRKKAIENSIKKLKENEVLLIAGKGSETEQDINNLKIEYSDLEVVKKCIKKLKNQ